MMGTNMLLLTQLSRRITWPVGDSGDLLIEDGQTYTIQAGDQLDFRDITIEAGGTLLIDGDSSQDITFLGVSRHLVLDGQIIGNSLHNGGVFSSNSPDDEPVSYTIVQNNGGRGGFGFNTGPRQNQVNGWGAGGNGGSNGYVGGAVGGTNNGDGLDTSLADGGSGGVTLGDGMPGIGSGAGGNGGGSGGGAGADDAGAFGNGAGGGGAGYKGKHGLGLYIQVRGTISGSGEILLNGTNGFNGGAGGSSPSGQGGGGGGGSAGGSGGKLWLRKRSSATLGDITVNTDGGSGGLGGAKGGGEGNPGTPGPGEDGQFGDNGSVDIQDI